jgi:hypothetical protein
MTDSAAPKPDWIPTTIEELQRRLARGEWPRVRAIGDKPGPFQLIQGRLIEFDGRCGTVLAEPGLEGTAADLTERSTTVWAVPESDATEAVLDAFDDLTEMRSATVDEWTEHANRWSEPMAAKMRANARIRGGTPLAIREDWLNDSPKVLLDRAHDEVEGFNQALVMAIKAARDGSHFVQARIAGLRADAASVANAVMMVADAVEHQGASLKRWRVPEVRVDDSPVRIAIGPYLIHEQRGPDGTSGLTIRKNNEVDSDIVFEIEASGTGNWRHSAYPSKAEDAGWLQGLSDLSPEQLEAYANTGKINGAPVAAKPGHRALTLTAETLALARRVATYLIEWTHRTTPDPIDQDTATAKRLLVELSHAEGMPADDLRKLCKWARGVVRARVFELNTGSIHDARAAQGDPVFELVEIIDRILMHLAIDEMPVGSIDVRGMQDVDRVDLREIDRMEQDEVITGNAATGLRAKVRDSKVEVAGGTHLRALGFAVDTAAIRKQIRSETKRLIEGAKAKLAEAESLDRLGDWLRENMGEHFSIEGIADTAIRRLREGDRLLALVRADLRHREDELEAMEADDWRECKAQALPLTTALKRIDAILRGSDPAEVSEATVIMSAEAADELAVRVAVLEQRVRASRLHGGERTDQLRSVIELGPFEVHRSQQDDLDGETMLAVHETSDNLTERVFAITFTRINGQAKWSKWTIDNSARRLVASLSLALLKIDAISRGYDPSEVEQATTNGFVGPDGLVSSKLVQVIVGRIAEHFDGFRQLAQRTMTATAELAALEALIHRGFDRLREVDPEFVESLRKGGS